MDFKVVRTNSADNDFLALIKLLDSDLNGRYGELQKEYDKHNKVDMINDVAVIYKDGAAIGCGAFKEFDSESVEMKRVFIKPENRGQGFSKIIMNELEKTAKSKGYKYAVLETGIKQHEAIGLYTKLGYSVTENFGPYVGMETSVCMRKEL
jgi:N-acetylglutamate synthase-like GNAT family acetyltransferase